MAKTITPNLAFEVRNEISLIVLKHGPDAPSRQEWTQYLQAVSPLADRLEEFRILVLTDGGRPQRFQQAEMNTMFGGRSIRTAVVSSSTPVRFVISVMAFLNPGIRGFAPSHLGDAYAYLGLTPKEGAVAESIARRLSRTVGSVAPLAS